jgi:hypothetical protein
MRRPPLEGPAGAFVCLILLGLLVSSVTRFALYLIQ